MRAEELLAKRRQRDSESRRLRRITHPTYKGKPKYPLLAKPDTSKIALVIRVAGDNETHPKIKSLLARLRLLRMNSAVFLHLDKKGATLLEMIAPYVVFGLPTLNTIRQLLLKRGTAATKDGIKPITNNVMIEEHLGEQGIICLDDIIHEIHTVGPNFRTVNKFLRPFELHKANSNRREERFKQYIARQEGQSTEIDVNKMVEEMN